MKEEMLDLLKKAYRYLEEVRKCLEGAYLEEMKKHPNDFDYNDFVDWYHAQDDVDDARLCINYAFYYLEGKWIDE